MSFESALKAWPAHWATCPVYRKNYTIQREGKPDYTSDGKVPMAATRYDKYSPARSALKADSQPTIFSAVGVWSGPRSSGLAVLDIDANLGALQLKWGDDLKGPKVISTKQAAGKFLFTVPEELWDTVADVSHSGAGNQGFEVLWGRMAVLEGEYPGSERYGAPEGRYSLSGDLSAIPPAPQWLIALMQESKAEKDGRSSRKNKGLDPYRARTREEREVIVSQCLDYIPPQGMGEDGWWKIGAMVHSADLGDRGLELWSAWSQQDQDYAGDWENGDPCAERWTNFKADGGYGIGTLIRWADDYDPTRKRFQGNSGARIVEETEAVAITTRQATLSFEEAMAQAEEAMDLPNPAERNFRLNQIALAAGYRDQIKLEQNYVDHISFKDETGSFTLDELASRVTARSFLIPDVLATPSVVVIYAEGGKGKSTACWTLAKHIATGTPFIVRGKPMPVEQGDVLVLNGDQPLADLYQQLTEVEYPLDKRTVLQSNWNLQYYAQFQQLMKTHQPKLVIIDSLIGCSGGKAFDENKSDFATPLYWLTRNNGTLFPGTTILIIHHANKNGGFRGTSAIRDAVTETWKLAEPPAELVNEGKVPESSRLLTIEKSRNGRSGTSLILRQEDDLSFSIADFTPEVSKKDKSPASISDRVLERVRIGQGRWFALTDLNSDPCLGGKVTAIRKACQRLESRGLLRSREVSSGKGGLKKEYQAVLACGGLSSGVQYEQNPSPGTEETLDTTPGQEVGVQGCEPGAAKSGHIDSVQGVCPGSDPCDEAESACIGHSGTYPHARNERSPEELERLNDDAWNEFDLKL
jgi:hypothetical protein